MSEISFTEDAEKAADLFVAVLSKALANRVLDEAFAGQITMPQLQSLRYLLYNDDRLMSDLAEGLDISYPAATKTVERLVKKGLVVREGDPTDRRVVRVHLTEQGKGLVEEINAEMNSRLASVIERLEPADREALMTGLRAFVCAALEEIDNREIASSICLHCGRRHRGDCPVGAAMARSRDQ
ncbi:MAG: MarR family winged helix-turn-helix transcriptional regulator [Chloroflexota bacterium]